jgi:dUTP pyrophosphatase
MTKLRIYKTSEHASVPRLATERSACVDVTACMPVGTKVKYFTYGSAEPKQNETINGSFSLAPFSRALIPTGLILDIPQGFSVRAHPRSGLAFKQGLSLANAEGVIDEDYVDPLFVMLINFSGITQVIKHGDRIAQIELYQTISTEIEEMYSAPEQKTSRNGGIGSTGR